MKYTNKLRLLIGISIFKIMIHINFFFLIFITLLKSEITWYWVITIMAYIFAFLHNMFYNELAKIHRHSYLIKNNKDLIKNNR